MDFQSSYLKAANFFQPDSGVILTQATLRSETLLGTQNNIPFAIKENVQIGSATTLPSEVRLRQNDAFIVTSVSVALKTIGSATPTDTQQLTAILYNYANPKIFLGTNRPNVAAIFQSGLLSCVIDSTTYDEFLAVKRCERVFTSQQGTTSAAIAGPVEYLIGRDENPAAMTGFYDLFPFIGFNGQQTTEFKINLGSSVAFADASISTYAVLLLDGWLCANGAQYFNKAWRDNVQY